MKFEEAPAHAAQLAELLEAVLKRSGHLAGAPTGVAQLIEVACHIVAAPLSAELPVVVVMLGGGTIRDSYATSPARIIFVDDDIEGLERSQTTRVLGEHQYVVDGAIDVRPDCVARVLEDLAAHVPSEEGDDEDDGEESQGLRS